MQVIDVSSSPEPQGFSMPRRTRSASRQPGPSGKRARLAAREPSIVEVIELTDSDNELPMPPASKKARTQPGPSGSDAVDAFGEPDPGILVDAAASMHGSSQRRSPRVWHEVDQRLFLPGSDDDAHAGHLPPDPVAPALASRASQHRAREEQWGDGQALSLLKDDEAHAVHSPPGPVHQDGPDAVPQELQPIPPEPPAPVPLDPVDVYIARVLEIVPDVQPTHVLALVEQLMQSQEGNIVEFVLHALFENPAYPKVDRKGKHRRDEPEGDANDRASPRPRVDYTDQERVYNCGPHYFKRSLEQLMMDFPRIPKPHIRNRLLGKRFYAPTYLLLSEELTRDPLPFKLKSTNSVVSKGKIREDPEFDKEREWVLLRVAELANEQAAALAASVNKQEAENNEQGIECGCCFSDYPFDQMVQCPEAHLFCKSCMTSYASNLLGEHNANIVCMDQSGCKLPFPESELTRFLSSKLLELYHRVKQRKEIEAAGLENLEECPFCEYKCVIENEMEKLFRCYNADCNAITCRACKKPDHLPKSCKEADEDQHLDVQHVIEEAMTQALMRNCPKCQNSFIKETGCNKMTCPNCHTISCYICRKIINGYDHFANPSHGPSRSARDKSKCNLWDPVEQRHAEEVSEAAKRTLAELRKTRPDVDERNIKVDLPEQIQARLGPAPQAPLMLHGGLPMPANIAGGMPNVAVPGMGMGMGVNMGGLGPAMAVPWGGGVGMGAGNPFVFGEGQPHQFLPPPVIQRFPNGLPGAAVPPPALPVALARAPPAHFPPQPVMAAGGGGRRKRRR